ncbi:MAG: ATP-dependent Clp protease proteolytic subunit [Proteobacteria bacterium]|nr:ATP-dependent Clp protease proteolytic subunit [Pseudomonadota bacterium]
MGNTHMSNHTLVFSAGIDPQSANAFIQQLAQLQAAKVDKLTIAMNSGGGNVHAGILMYNAIRAMPFEVTTHNIGHVDSIANIIFLAGSTRYACGPSTFMFHGVGFDLNAGQRLEEASLEAMLDTVLTDHKRMSAIIAGQTGLSPEAGMELFKQQKTKDAKWAKDNGLIKEIRDFAYPQSNVTLFVQ